MNKFIKFLNNHEYYEVRNKKSSVLLGIIYYYKPWKKWLFENPNSRYEHFVYDVECLQDIVDFMRELKKR